MRGVWREVAGRDGTGRSDLVSMRACTALRKSDACLPILRNRSATPRGWNDRGPMWLRCQLSDLSGMRRWLANRAQRRIRAVPQLCPLSNLYRESDVSDHRTTRFRKAKAPKSALTSVHTIVPVAARGRRGSTCHHSPAANPCRSLKPWTRLALRRRRIWRFLLAVLGPDFTDTSAPDPVAKHNRPSTPKDGTVRQRCDFSGCAMLRLEAASSLQLICSWPFRSRVGIYAAVPISTIISSQASLPSGSTGGDLT